MIFHVLFYCRIFQHIEEQKEYYIEFPDIHYSMLLIIYILVGKLMTNLAS